ncbi:hypothetical protein [Streptococcus loxodontisalivarius]|uniref:Uncharacterized protein n=1 Tax=Streptococcus loxodontisalivarius TaxID=1349415 RepID=A0ABS2PRA8_9STRE|nr:hypothetical protein [Streptococcus loxodontisalivarius]MBM7642473.1 hypothetical protein [Streptococcus loxodontisalivarius]
MKATTIEKLAHELVEVKNNLELQSVSIDMLGGYNKPNNRELLTIYLYKMTEVLYDNLQNVSHKIDDVVCELYQAAENLKITEDTKLKHS